MFFPAEQSEIVSSHERTEVRRSSRTGQQGLYSLHHFAAGEIITAFNAGSIASEPSYLTVQTGIDRHITLQPGYLQFVNHSCSPNVFFNTTGMEFLALRDILPGEELVFFYPSTEWSMKQPFRCHCGSPACLGEIRGAAHLPKKLLRRYKLTDFILRQLGRKTSRKVA